jgi:hypothetical protein
MYDFDRRDGIENLLAQQRLRLEPRLRIGQVPESMRHSSGLRKGGRVH